MWLLNTSTIELEYFEGQKVPPYAILSHRWENDEVTFQDVMQGRAKLKKGYGKIYRCCQVAIQEKIWDTRPSDVLPYRLGLSYAWIDTCCIDKSNSAELSEAINSMYDWYRNAVICYAYLSDVDENISRDTTSTWFTRGWTLQELLAPTKLRFYNALWLPIGERDHLKEIVSNITMIPETALSGFVPQSYSVAEKMSWASTRHTTRLEDESYCLLGLFEVNLPMIYGEGRRAFQRLQQEILRTTTDLTIFSFSTKHILSLSNDKIEDRTQLADSPAWFNTEGKRIARLPADVGNDELHAASVLASGITTDFRLIPYFRDMYLVPICWYDQGTIASCMLVHRHLRPTLVTYKRVVNSKYSLIPISWHFWERHQIRRVVLARGFTPSADVQAILGYSDDALDLAYGFRVEVVLRDPNETTIECASAFRPLSPHSYKTGGEVAPNGTAYELLLEKGTYGVAGVVRIKTTVQRTKYYYFGLTFDFDPFCLIITPHFHDTSNCKSDFSELEFTLPKLDRRRTWNLASSQDMTKVVEMLWPRMKEFQLASEGIELHHMQPRTHGRITPTEGDAIEYDDRFQSMVGITIGQPTAQNYDSPWRFPSIPVHDLARK